jgi:hypothetical protein
VGRTARALVIGCAFLLGVLAAWPACRAYDRSEYADLTRDDASDAASDDAHTNDATTGCAPRSDGNPCFFIPRLGGPQNVDGRDDEFCGVAENVFVAAKGVATTVDTVPAPAPPGLDTTARVRVAWSPAASPQSGLHVFVHVDKSPVTPAPAGEALYLYDAVELFASGTSPQYLTGRYGGSAASDRGAIHVVISPPGPGGEPGRASLYQVDGPKVGDLLASQFATRLVPGGFDVEVGLDWGTLGLAAAPGPGALAGFDFGLDLRSATSDGGTYRFQSFFFVRDITLPPPPKTACTPGLRTPFCDDRLWCMPTLQ